MTRLVDQIQQRAEDVGLNRVAATYLRRKVFEKYADLHLLITSRYRDDVPRVVGDRFVVSEASEPLDRSET